MAPRPRPQPISHLADVYRHQLDILPPAIYRIPLLSQLVEGPVRLAEGPIIFRLRCSNPWSTNVLAYRMHRIRSISITIRHIKVLVDGRQWIPS